MGAAYADSEKASKLAPSVQRESMIVVIQGYRKYLVKPRSLRSVGNGTSGGTMPVAEGLLLWNEEKT